MTDRIKGFTVVLEKDIRSDDAEATRLAIEQLKGVISVKGLVSNVDDLINRCRIRREVLEKVYDLIQKEDQ